GHLVELEGEGFARRLAANIDLLMQDTDLSRTMGRRGRERVEAIFSWEAVAKQTTALYQSLQAS
ncbi:MAG: glycogen synthase, partial [Bacteroidota bacterium]|nr:glycogen synthase [Bacteroidota bacterium]